MRLRLLPLLWLLLLFPALAEAQTTLSDRSASGALTAAWNGTLPQPTNTAVLVSLPSSGSFSVQLTGTFSATVQFEALIDQPRATWLAIKGTPFTAGGTTVSAASATGAWVFPGGGVKVFRVRCSAYTSGTIQVGIVASAAINTGTVAGGSGGGGGTATSVSAADEAAFTVGADPFNPIGGLFNDSAAALTAGQQGIARVTPNRAQHVNLRNNSGTEIGTSANPVRTDPTGSTTQPVSGTVTITPSGTQAVSIAQVPAAGALADATANPTTTGIANYPFLFNGTTWDRLRDTTGANGATSGALAAGLMVFDTIDAQYKRANSIASGIAGGLTGKNVPAVGGMRYTVAHGSAPTTYAAGAYVHELSDRVGVPFTIGGHPDVKTFAVQYTSAQTDVAVVTIASGLKIVVTGFMVTTSNANSVNVSCRLGFGTANVPAYGNNGLLGTDPNIAAGSGFGRGNGSGIIGVGADDEDLRFTCSVPTGGAVDVNVSYYTVPS